MESVLLFIHARIYQSKRVWKICYIL